jgi:hypothetical protein
LELVTVDSGTLCYIHVRERPEDGKMPETEEGQKMDKAGSDTMKVNR